MTDASGAVIPKATVAVENIDTGVKTTDTTNEAGVYSIRFLPIGHYKVAVNAPGFSTVTTSPFTLEINQTVKLNSKLMAGSATSVEVTDTSAILNTTDATLGVVISANEIGNIPLEGRNFSSLTLFQPGAVNTDPTGMTGNNAIERNTFNNGIASINGNRNQANNYLLDGIDLNEGQNNLIGYNPAPDSIAEIKVISANAPATYGNVNGGSVIAVLKSGTNQFHGSAYAYLQNDKMDANSWNNKYKGLVRAPFTQLIFGGTFGGPIIKDKLFFFGDYEGARNHHGGFGSASVLTPDMLKGNFAAYTTQLYDTQAYNPVTGVTPIYAGNQVPVVNPVAKFLAANPQYYPAPNATPDPGTLTGDNYHAPQKSYVKNNQFDVKLEWDPRTKDKITAFYAQSRARDGNTPVLVLSFPSINNYPSTLGGGTWVHTFSSAIVNEARLGFTRVNWQQGIPTDPSGAFGYGGDAKVGVPFGSQRYVGFTEQDITAPGGVSTIGNRGAPQLFIDNTFTYGDNLTIQWGKHLLSMGVTALRYQQNYTQSQNAGALGYFQYSGVFVTNQKLGTPNYGPADFVLSNVSDAQLQDGGEFGNRQWRAAGFFQDDWKVMRNLTFNLGLRYEYDEPMVEANNKNANVLPLNGGTIEYAGSVPAGAPAGSIVCPTTACYKPSYKQFMPRLGFALQVTPRFVIRGGYGASSFFEGDDANQRLTNNPPFVSVFNDTSTSPTPTSGGVSRSVASGFNTPTSAINSSSSTPGAWPQNIQPAYIQEYNLTTEFALNAKTSLTVGYVGETGQYIEDYGNANQLTQAQAFDVYVTQPTVLPAKDITPYANLVGETGGLLITESRAMMNYNALQITLRQRESHGLEYTVNYTYAKAMTNAAGNFGVPNVNQTLAFQDYYNSAADYGPSGQDIRHNLNAVVVYKLPYGHGRQFGSGAGRLLDETLGGWSLSSTLVAFTGVPVTLFDNGGNTGSYGSARPNQYTHMKIVNRTIRNWWGTDPSAVPCLASTGVSNGICAYGQSAVYAFGTAANGTERAPGYYQVDSSLFKDFRVVGEQKLSFRADFFNILNVADYGNPDSNIGDYNSNPTQNSFGVINSTRNQERRLQLGLTYTF